MKNLHKLPTKHGKKIISALVFISLILDIYSKNNLILNFFLIIYSILLFEITLPLYSIILTSIIMVLIFIFIIRIKTRKITLKILEAQYGVKDNRVDIANRLNDLIDDNKLDYPLTNSIYGSDPVLHAIKTCLIKYQYGKLTRSKNYIEEERIKLPTFLDQLHSLNLKKNILL